MNLSRKFCLIKEDHKTLIHLEQLSVKKDIVSFHYEGQLREYLVLKKMVDGIWLQNTKDHKNIFIAVKKEKNHFICYHKKGVSFIQNEQQMINAARMLKRHGSTGATQQEIWDYVSPMPGKIWKLLKKVGEEVKSGDVLVQMEAMKVEYTLKSTVNGKVQQVLVKEGQVVALGDLLMKLTP
jgi:biotin carboxyl carrier protein